MKIGVDDYDTSVEQGESWRGVRFAPEPRPADGELYVYPYSDRDEFGRRRFFLYWRGYRHGVPAGQGGSGYGLRGQVFHADDRPRIREHIEAGGRSFWWPSGKEITLDELAASPAR